MHGPDRAVPDPAVEKYIVTSDNCNENDHFLRQKAPPIITTLMNKQLSVYFGMN